MVYKRQYIYSKTDGNKTFYSYKEDGGYTKVEDFTCTLFSAYVFDLKDSTEDDKKKIQLLSSSYDISDKKYVEEIVAELR